MDIEKVTARFLTELRADPEELVALAEHAALVIHGPEWVEEQKVTRMRRIAEVEKDPATVGAAMGMTSPDVTKLAKKHGVTLFTGLECG
ncbi:hypothetical protein ASH02_24155 [Nocardioides sp. Soil796]|nr:hypothetical protein ASH02_24155 [Nocardioides sp. Soil796]